MADLDLVETNQSNLNESVGRKSPCAYCHVTNSVGLYKTYSVFGDEFSLDNCLACGAVFLNPRPTDEQLSQAYDDSYYGTGDTKFGSTVEKILDVFRGARVRRVCGHVKPGGRVLDVGCGRGGFLKKLSKRGFEAFGTELEGQAARRAMQVDGIKIKTGPLLEADFDKDFFDAVCMWHVFEHLTEPKRTMEITDKILKPGGYLFLSMPNIESIQSRLFRGNWLHLDPPRHLFFLADEKLVSVMKDFGFSMVRKRFFSLEQNVFGFQQSILNCILKKRDVLFEVLKGNKSFAQDYSALSITLQKFFWVATFPLFALIAGLEAVFKKGGTMEFVFQKEVS
jgi:SAM-dependent methyltransferase